MKIVIPGGSGQVGAILSRAFERDGHEVVILSRSRRKGFGVRTVRWDARTVGDWAAEIDGADAVVNLAGRNVNCRYSAANRRAILDSRVESTRAVAEAIARAAHPPHVWLQSSTATIYAHWFGAPNDEEHGVIGGREYGAPDAWRFSIEVAKAWEEAVESAGPLPQTRVVLLRSAMVMSPDRGGVFDTLLRLVRLGLGGRAGDGKQYVSWIHEHDFVHAVTWLLGDETMRGPVNLAAPGALPNAAFMRALRKAWGARIGLPAACWMLELGAFLLRTETELVLKSRRVTPARLLQRGFRFEYPAWPDAARELCERWRKTGGRQE